MPLVKLRTRIYQSGIALGPILFIIAVLAILAAAIAAGSGAFSSSTSTEGDKAMAQVIINTCDDYQRALNLMLSNGCNEASIDWTPNGGLPAGLTMTGVSLDGTGGNGTNIAGSGQCAMFDPRGGGLLWKPIPTAAMMTNFSTVYTGDSFVLAGLPVIQGTMCLYGKGICGPSVASSASNGAILAFIFGISKSVCSQINSLLGLSSINISVSSLGKNLSYSVFNSGHSGYVRTNGGPVSPVGPATTSSAPVGVSGACLGDYDAGYPVIAGYTYVCPVMIR